MNHIASNAGLGMGSGEAITPTSLAPESITVSPDLVMLSDPGGVAAESIRQLRTRVIAQHVDRGGRALAFCSADASSGCSFVAANLAVAFAQIGTRVLLVNADMRLPGLDPLFGSVGAGSGLLQYLEEKEDGAGQLTLYEVFSGLSLLPSGGESPNAQELLSGKRFESFFNQCLREFDLTIIDAPPANRFADAQRIAAIARYAVIVARSNRTYFGDIAQLSRQLGDDGVTIVGTILNDH
jgi:capsular exopolysaccharide synthesis family protein